jgi:hypothetical protein
VRAIITMAVATALAIAILGVAAGCARRSPGAVLSGPDVEVPAGLDSAQTQAWMARQRADCPGRLVMLKDVRVFAVRCVHDSTTTRHPPNDR